jgi:muramoyltetrapeptide carboxypeptidase
VTPTSPTFDASSLTLPRRGDVARIIAPAGPFDRTLFWRGLGFLADTFKLQLGAHVFEREGFVAGCAQARVSDLRDAIACPEASLIICARGGVGCADLFAQTLLESWSPTSTRPKWLVGFSDITALHSRWQSFGIPSIHGSNVTSLGLGCAPLRERWLAHVLNPLRPQRWQLETLYPGDVRGPLVGGNLAVLHDLCASRQWSPPAGAILFLEEVAEPPYRIHRMLSALRRGGALSDVAGLVVGQVTASPPGPHRVTARQVFATLCKEWQLPCAWGLPAGHEVAENHPLTLGRLAVLNAQTSAATLSV